MDASERAVRGAGGARIGREQVTRLILRADAAWRAQCLAGLADEREGFDVWRKGALWDAVSRASFRDLTQREWGLALGHFEALAGGTGGGRAAAGRAIAARERTGEGDRRRAEWVLRRTCREEAEAFGGEAGALDYARELLRRIHRAELEAASARAIWQTVFTLRQRGSGKRREAARAEAGVEAAGSVGARGAV